MTKYKIYSFNLFVVNRYEHLKSQHGVPEFPCIKYPPIHYGADFISVQAPICVRVLPKQTYLSDILSDKMFTQVSPHIENDT